MNSFHQSLHPSAFAPRHRRCHVFHLGLPAREVLILESLFRVRPQLAQQYRFAPTTEELPADLVFVDGDDAGSMRLWQEFHQAHPQSQAVFVSAESSGGIEGITLARPLSFRNLDDIAYALRAATPPEFTAAEKSNGLRVLVVDDSPTAREMLNARLEEAAGSSPFPLQVDYADCGRAALEKAGEKPYDLVFLDVVLPDLDGFEVCRQLKQGRPTRIALVSSRKSAIDYDRGHDAGCDHYLAKPAPPEMINTVVRLTAMKKAMPTH